MRNLVRVSLAGLFLGANLATAFAQATPEQMEMAYNAARNQLGVLQYCQEKGYTDGGAIEIQTKMIALIPAPADTFKAEEKLCQTMADAVKQAGAQLPQ